MTAPDHDELRIRGTLLRKIDGQPPTPAAPARGDWWDRLYDDTPDHHGATQPRRLRIPTIRRPDTRKPPATETVPEQPGPGPDHADPQWEDAPPADETTPAAVARGRRDPAREWQAGWSQIQPRMRWFLVNAACAAMGWGLGLVPLLSGALADCGHQSGTTAALCLGVGFVLATAIADGYARAHAWWPPLAWAARIPLASAALALALYAPGAAS
jgi:hypothetical protein